MQDNIHVTARAVVIKDAHILLAYDPRSTPAHYYEFGKHFYYLPGGHIDFKESARAAVIREIAEETGYVSICNRFLGAIEHSWSFKGDEACCHTHEINLLFKVNIPALHSLVEIAKIEEHVAFKWIPLIEIEAIDLRPVQLKQLIPQWNSLDLFGAFSSTM